MNRHQVEGPWNQLVGEAKQAWGELTDDDIKRAEGSFDKLVGIIQTRFGDAADSIRRRLRGYP
jgi:uncharacterized protein YjbJ (UPF0337 family)